MIDRYMRELNSKGYLKKKKSRCFRMSDQSDVFVSLFLLLVGIMVASLIGSWVIL